MAVRAEQNLTCDKDLDQLLEVLRSLEFDLRAQGVIELNMFGSRSRYDYRPDSDLDLLARLEDRVGLLDIVGLQRSIGDRVGVTVQITPTDGLRPDTLRAMTAHSLIVF